MKKAIILFLIVMPVWVYGQTQTENYVKTIQYQIGVLEGNESSITDDEKIETITYFDGLGRAKQTITQRSGGNREDMVTPIEYDFYGRQPKEYLPLPIGAQSGNFYEGTGGTLVTDELKTFYKAKFPNDFYQGNNINYIPDWDNPYSEQIFENNPRSRVIEQGAPGFDWHVTHGGDHTVKNEYGHNASNEVPNFTVEFLSGGDTSLPSLALNGSYVAGTLVKTITRNENWDSSQGNNHSSVEFKDKKGQILLKQIFNGGVTHDTHYIFDKFGNLTFVLSPEASDRIMDTSNNLVSDYQDVLDNYGYQYKYDSRNRLIEKKIPGKGVEYILYDKLDRPVMTQDANLRADSNKWLFTKYDVYGRVAYTGIYTPPIGETKSQIQNNLLVPQYWNEERITAATQIGDVALHYTNQVFPLVNLEVLTINYYDSYVDMGTMTLPNTVYGVTVSNAVQGLLTVNKSRVLSTGDWIESHSGYDDKGRVIYTRSVNSYLDTNDVLRRQLDFTGKPLETWGIHAKTGNAPITTYDYFHYDHLGRVVSHKQKVDNEPVQLIAENVYDEIGQLIRKHVGGETFVDGYTDLEEVDITFDGTITKIGDAWNWPAMAKTKGEIPTGYNGGVKATVMQNDRNIRVGLMKANNGNTLNDYFDYAIHAYYDPATSTQQIRLVIESQFAYNGGQSFGTYQTGDTFKVERIGSEIRFYKNTSLLHFVTVGDEALVGKMAFSGPSGSISGVSLFGTNIDKKLQDIDFKYNVHGWLTDINDVGATQSGFGLDKDLFKFRINYNKIEGDYGTGVNVNPLYNGNIAETIWKTSNTDKQKRSYGYHYDPLNRIKGAVSRKGSLLDTWDSHSLAWVSYDLNGNINTLQRNGHGTGTTWDDLVYEYDGNQLTKVTEKSTAAVKDEGFRDGINPGDDYLYDVNGNMISDANKRITNITYNHLNLPVTVNIDNGTDTGTITYVYDATGTKLKKTFVKNTDAAVNTEYAGAFVYSDMESVGTIQLQFISQPEGYIEPTVKNGTHTEKAVKGFSEDTGQITYSDYNYVFQYKDHLGNIRLSYCDSDKNGSINANTEIIEESHHYPFGLRQKGYNFEVSSNGNVLAQKFKMFQGQEKNEELQLNWHSFKWRNHQSDIARFFNTDPLAEQYVYNSPYAFSENRVIDGVELEGLEYVDASEARVFLRPSGEVMFNMSNMSAFTRAAFETANSDPAYWPEGTMGAAHVNTSLGYLDFSVLGPDIDVTHGYINQVTKIGKPIAASTGQESRWYKDRYIGNGPVVGAREARAAKGLLIIEGVRLSFKGLYYVAAQYDKAKVKTQIGLFRKAAYDLQSAYEDGLIPLKFYNTEGFSKLLNVIFFGGFSRYDSEITELGLQIYYHYNPSSREGGQLEKDESGGSWFGEFINNAYRKFKDNYEADDRN